MLCDGLQGEGPVVKDMLEAGILDPYLVKHWGIKLATNAAITVLRVDQVHACNIRIISIYIFFFSLMQLLQIVNVL